MSQLFSLEPGAILIRIPRVRASRLAAGPARWWWSGWQALGSALGREGIR
ncbi:MAG TPA: hypothetical protein VF037_06155 [Gemmatimonadales bacterium]